MTKLLSAIHSYTSFVDILVIGKDIQSVYALRSVLVVLQTNTEIVRSVSPREQEFLFLRAALASSTVMSCSS